jgi:hypothetical protein
MNRSTIRLSRRAAFAFVLSGATLTAAGAATFHRFAAVSQGTGSEGATNFLQSSTSSSALQGNVGTADTGIKIPFGVMGVVDAASPAPFGVGVIGISTTGYGIGAESTTNQPSLIADGGGSGIGIEALSQGGTPISSSEAIYAEAKGNGDGADIYADGGGRAINAFGENGGDGIDGSTNSGVGVAGTTFGGTEPAIQGTSFSSSFSDGVYGTSDSGDAVHGDLTSTGGHAALVGTVEGIGNGVYATSANGMGVVGIESTAASPMPTSAPNTYAGVYAQSQNGPGLYGVNLHNTGTGVAMGGGLGRRDSFSAVYGFGNDGAGVFAYSNNDYGAFVDNNNDLPALVVNADDSDAHELIEAFANDGGEETDVFNVTTSGDVGATGNIYYGGSLIQTDATHRSGASEGTYAAQQTEATVEDVGSAQLVNGSAAVPIAADFRDTIDVSHAYMVFITPDGPNHGLYVASKSPAGFIVRENDGGRSSLAFDYRIVAHPFGKRLARLPRIDQNTLRNKNRAAGTHRPAAFDGAAPDTMAASRLAEIKVRAHIAAQRKTMLAALASHRSMRGAPPPIPAGIFTLTAARR